MTRHVLLLCGPPGSGKTTYAHTLGLDIYDVDDPVWPSERAFRAALRRLAHDPHAQAVVIRAGATCEARRKATALCAATTVQVLAVDATTCISRVLTRGRPTAHREVAAVGRWWERYEPEPPSLGRPSRAW